MALKPVAGEPVGQVLYSQGSVKVVGVLDKELFPDWFRAGADRMTFKGKSVQCVRLNTIQGRDTVMTQGYNMLPLTIRCVVTHEPTCVRGKHTSPAILNSLSQIRKQLQRMGIKPH